METTKELIKIIGTLVRDAAVLTICDRAYVKVLVKIEAPDLPKVKEQIAFSFLSSVIVIPGGQQSTLSYSEGKQIDAFMLSKAGDKVEFTVYKNKYGIPEAEIQQFRNPTLDIGDTF